MKNKYQLKQHLQLEVKNLVIMNLKSPEEMKAENFNYDILAMVTNGNDFYIGGNGHIRKRDHTNLNNGRQHSLAPRNNRHQPAVAPRDPNDRHALAPRDTSYVALPLMCYTNLAISTMFLPLHTISINHPQAIIINKMLRCHRTYPLSRTISSSSKVI